MATVAAGTGHAPATMALRLLPNEVELYRAAALDVCGEACTLYHTRDMIVISDRRVLFQWKRLVCGLPLDSAEESFLLSELQWVHVGRKTEGSWAAMGLALLVLGAVLAAAGGVAGDTGSGPALKAIGAILIIVGALCFVVWLIKFLRRGMQLHLNFCRCNAGIADWYSWSLWRPHHSSTRRTIVLDKAEAFDAYHFLQGILHRGTTAPAAGCAGVGKV